MGRSCASVSALLPGIVATGLGMGRRARLPPAPLDLHVPCRRITVRMALAMIGSNGSARPGSYASPPSHSAPHASVALWSRVSMVCVCVSPRLALLSCSYIPRPPWSRRPTCRSCPRIYCVGSVSIPPSPGFAFVVQLLANCRGLGAGQGPVRCLQAVSTKRSSFSRVPVPACIRSC